jgi:hypothetical protein
MRLTFNVAANGSAEQKALYLPKIASGEWAGTMCLTEPHAGTDLGLFRTRAIPQPDGTHTTVLQRMDEEGSIFRRMLVEPAAMEAFSAFLQKRKPDFS